MLETVQESQEPENTDKESQECPDKTNSNLPPYKLITQADTKAVQETTEGSTNSSDNEPLAKVITINVSILTTLAVYSVSRDL